MQAKKLAIITDCLHVQLPDGQYGTDNAIFLKQMEALACSFEETIICCPVVAAKNQHTIAGYTHHTISFLPVPDAGGTTLKSKLRLVATLPHWFAAFKKINIWADVVYQRFPNNINIPGLLYFYVKQKNVFGQYTGNWTHYNGEPFTYRLQKKWLKKYFRGPAGIYFKDAQHPHLFQTFSPSYTAGDWHAEKPFVEAKKLRWQMAAMPVPVFIAVGLLAPLKNQQFILDCFLILHRQGFLFQLYIAGDGVLKTHYEQFVQQNNLQQCVFILGRQNHDELKTLYRKADFLVHASLVEGYVKVPVEGFFHGVIPLINNIAIAREMIGDNERGYIFSVADKQEFIDMVKGLLHDKKALLQKMDAGRAYAFGKTIERWRVQMVNELEAAGY